MNRRLPWLLLLAIAAWFTTAPAWAQRRPYIGYVYPAGGQIGLTFQVRVGGQELDEVDRILVSGSGVSARVVENLRRLNNQEVQLIREQLKELKRGPTASVASKAAAASEGANGPAPASEAERQAQIARLEKRLREWVQTPACASIAGLVIIEVTIAPDAEAGPREIRLSTPKGISNPLAFRVGQVLEYARTPMTSATIQVLGKEAAALRQRPPGEAEDRVDLPCTVNGQIASGEVNRYRFVANKGQRLVISTEARQLIPYIADAVPGWFQPVLVLTDARGKEVAFADDYRFKPDPVILYEVPQDGEYVFAIHDSLYRGREDFVYRITIGDLPFVTSLFPLGGKAGAVLLPSIEGWNVADADLASRPADTVPALQMLAASRLGYRSNRVPFAVEALPEQLETEPNDTPAAAQRITLPVILNGRISRANDLDVFQFTGRANDKVVIEVEARRLDSPLDSVIKITDAAGRVIAFNDDREDPTAGLNTHHADSYLLVKLPADGTYHVYLGDTARQGGPEYGYRLRVSAPQPDFELRVVPSSVAVALNTTVPVTVYAVRKDGFTGPIKVSLDNPPPGLSATAVTLAGTQSEIKLNLKSGAKPTGGPVRLAVVGSTKVGEKEIVHAAVAAEDRMQAFLWRHLVPVGDFQVVVYDRNYQAPPKRVARAKPSLAATIEAVSTTTGAAATTSPAGGTAATAAAKPKFTKQQIVGRLRQLKLLYEDGLLTDEFYDARVAECDASQ